jgi:hypothetical protein
MSEATHQHIIETTEHYLHSRKWGPDLVNMVGVACCRCDAGASVAQAREPDSGWTGRPIESGEEQAYGEDMPPADKLYFCPDCAPREAAA